MNGTKNGKGGAASGTGEVVLINAASGIAVIGVSTQLKGLNYFDGKFLRAEDLKTEQSFLRYQVRLSNQGAGAGVVYGYDVTTTDLASITVKQGLAFDPLGRALLLTVDKTLDLGGLIAATQKQDPTASGSPAGSSDFEDCTIALEGGTVPTASGSDLYLLTVAFVEALCGEEDVFGRLCEDACVDAKNRRFILDGVVFRALPLVGLGQLPGTGSSVPMEPKHYRSRVASAFFQAERQAVPSQVSGAGVQGGVFCLGARQLTGEDVPIAVFSRSGNTTNFLDAWIGRRERIEPPNRRYWAWRMSMRPWDVFLAQVFQFQCQLKDVLGGALTGGPGGDPCASKTAALGKAQGILARLERWHMKTAAAFSGDRALAQDIQPFAISEITGLKKDLASVLDLTPLVGSRILIDGGIVELPPAGYLPVTVGSIPTVNEQVRNLMGPGVDLRFCVCRPDFIPHVLEEAQHMERISLLDGIDDPANMPHVDVFVPDGTIVDHVSADDSRYFEGTFIVGVSSVRRETRAAELIRGDRTVHGAARWQPTDGGGMEFYFGGIDVSDVFEAVSGFGRDVISGIREKVRAMRSEVAATGLASAAGTPAMADWIGATVDKDPFQIGLGESAVFHVRLVSFEQRSNSDGGDHVQVTRIWPGLFTPTAPPQVVNGENGENVANGLFHAFTTDQEKPEASGQPVGKWSTTPLTLRKKRGTASYVEVTIDPNKPPFVVRWEWTGDASDKAQPINGELKLVFKTGEGAGTRERKLLELKEHPEVKNPGNPFHGYSETGIATLQQALAAPPFNDTSFASEAEGALFPQAVQRPGFDVLATRDWVVFARRRECTCQGEAFTPPQPPARFQVYWVDGDKFDGKEGDLFPQRLMEPAQIQYVQSLQSRGILNALDVVTFAAGAATLDAATAAAALSDLKAAVAAMSTLFSVLIGEEHADPLEGSRALSYKALTGGFLSPPAPPDETLTQVLSGTPPALADPTVDGVILVVVGTQAQVNEVVPEEAVGGGEHLLTVRLMRLEVNGDPELRAFESMKANGFWHRVSERVVDLGLFQVPAGLEPGGDPAARLAEQLRTKWGDHKPVHSRAFFRSSALEPARMEKLAQEIARGLTPGAGEVSGEAQAARGIADKPAFSVGDENADVVLIVASE